MDTFRLQIETDNAAFHPDAAPEIIRLLREVADKIDAGTCPGPADHLQIHDINGNRVGQAALYS